MDRSAVAPRPALEPHSRRRAWAAWAGGWGAVLALSAWMLRLQAGWLLAALAGALLWAALSPARRSWRLGVAAALLAAVSIGGAVQFRLGRVAGDWDRVLRQAEDHAEAELENELNGLFDRSFGAVDRAKALGRARRVTAGSFARLEEARRSAGVSALTVYRPDGSPLVWAGEHRGTVPDSVRAGLLQSSFSAGPLFGYVYFADTLSTGDVAVAAVLLDAHVSVGEGAEPFADGFAERYGVVPRFLRPDLADPNESVWDWGTAEHKILSVDFASITQERWRSRVAGRGRWAVGAAWLAAALLLAIAWYRHDTGPPGLPVAAVTLALVLLPLGETIGGRGVFSPLSFVLPFPGDVTLGQLLILLAGAAVWLLSRPRVGRPLARLPLALRTVGAAAVLVGVLWLVRESVAPGAMASRAAGGMPLIVAFSLLAALPLLVLLDRDERSVPHGRRAVLVVGAVVLAAALAVGVLLWWRPGREAPLWTAALWALPFALAAAALSRAQIGRGALLPWIAVGWIGASLALPNLWTLHLNARLQESGRELGRLGAQADPFLDFLLRQFAEDVLRLSAEGREGVSLLYQAWVDAGLAREGYEARVTLWNGEVAEAELRLSESQIPPDMQPAVLREARAAEEPRVERFTDLETLHYLLVAPLTGGRTVTVAVPPRRYLGRSSALARFLDPVEGGDEGSAATLSLVPAADARAPSPDSMRWVRAENGWRSEAVVRFPTGPEHAHLEVPTPSGPLLLARGVLVEVLVLVVLTLLWAVARTLCGEPLGLGSGQWGWLWSFRGRLTLALFAFFLLPMAAFGATTYRALSREVVRTAQALADRALEQAESEMGGATVAELARHVGAEFLLYHRGVLAEAAAPEVIDLGLYHAWLPPRVYLGFRVGEAVEAHEERRLAGQEYLVAYRRVGAENVLAAPTPLATGEIARRQRALADVVLLTGLLGAALSVILSLLVGRALSRPIEAMGRAAAAVGEGNLRVRLPVRRRDEFGPLFRTFNRMVSGLRETQSALVSETRRTEAIVAEAGTGVVAMDAHGTVALINPRACLILGAEVEAGERIPEDRPLPAAVAATVRGFLASGAREWTEEREVDARVVRLRLRRLLTEEGARGVVLVLEDVTAEIRSARVLAWGEMARQVAHEIKNPLTPMKLAVQHVRRAWGDQRPDFGVILDRNVDSVLREIDRLGEIARSFSRFGTPSESGEPLERVDVRRVTEDTLALYRGGDDGIAYSLELPEALRAVRARESELREVLVNLLENARGALDGGGEVRISAAPAGGEAWVALDVSDTGEGIAPELLPRIFEPRFSTKTSGTGLGLAIVRRLVESWGAQITVDSAVGVGTTVHLRLPVAEDGAEGG
jgi:two-component system, NtrC family, nitrogen regulation sensor histidine kinase NtrY